MAQRLPVDVIVPTYNGANYLRESLGSVAAQTCAVNAVIVVDDGSTDDTAAVARSLGAIVVTQPNSGISVARNAGIRLSRAPYVALLDADDRWHPERLEAQWRVVRARPDIAMIATDYALWTDGIRSQSVLAAQPHFRGVPRERLSAEAYVVSREAMLQALAVRNFVLPSSMLLDRRIFDRDDVFYCPREKLPEGEDRFIGEDYEWILRALRVTPVAFVDRVLVDYRQSAGAISARRGRIRYGDVALGKLIAAAPERYVNGAADAFARARPRALRESAIAHVKSGELSFAADRLHELAECAREPERRFARIGAALMRPSWMQRLLLPMTRLRPPRFR